LNPEFLKVSRQNLLVAKVPNQYFGSRVTTCAELNEMMVRELASGRSQTVEMKVSGWQAAGHK
jgi:hypothetical protein